MNLDLEDLLNVADANKYLKFATYMPFARKYAGKLVKIVFHCWNPLANVKPLRVLDEEITINGLKTIYQIKRCFGEMITDLELRFDYFPEFNRFTNYLRILSYIHEFGALSLRKLSLERAVGFENFKKPFVNVEDLEIRTCFLRKNCLSRVFPKLRRLKLPHYNRGKYLNIYLRSYIRLFPKFVSFGIGWSLDIHVQM